MGGCFWLAAEWIRPCVSHALAFGMFDLGDRRYRGRAASFRPHPRKYEVFLSDDAWRRAQEGGGAHHRPPEEAAFLAAHAYEAHNNTLRCPACCIRGDDRVVWPNEQASRARAFAAPPPQDSMHTQDGTRAAFDRVLCSCCCCLSSSRRGDVWQDRPCSAAWDQSSPGRWGPFLPSGTGRAESPWPSLLGRTGGLIA